MARGSGSQRLPIAQGQIPAENKIFRDWKGINTQARRQAINDDQFAWLENVMPIGSGNMKTIGQISSARATVAGGRTIYYAQSYNITGTDYFFLACTDGSAWQQLADSPYTLTQICAAGVLSGTSTQIAQWKNERILIVDPNCYKDWNGSSLTNLGGTTGAPAGGTVIGTFSKKVWIVISSAGSGRTIAWSAANSYTDFTGDGGSTTITDETLTSRIEQFLVANNFLYFFGADSINVISDVQVTGGNTLFSNTNIVSNSGTTIMQGIVPYYRSIWYINSSGVYALYGATPRKASDDLDGIVQLIDFTKPVTSGTVTLFNQLCVAFCFTYNDPTAGARQIIVVYFNRKWFVASQSTGVTGIFTRHGGTDALWGFNGSSTYQLFADTTSNISQTIQTKLWDFEDFISIKESLNFGIEVNTPNSIGSLSVTVESETQSVAPDVSLGGAFAFTWTNSLGAPFTWTNSLGNAFTWLTSGYVWFQGNVEIQGHYLGATIESSTAGNVYEGIQLQYRRLPAGWGA